MLPKYTKNIHESEGLLKKLQRDPSTIDSKLAEIPLNPCTLLSRSFVVLEHWAIE